jgi:hypothetical protein
MMLSQKATRGLFREIARAALDCEARLDVGGYPNAFADLDKALRAVATTSLVQKLPALAKK